MSVTEHKTLTLREIIAALTLKPEVPSDMPHHCMQDVLEISGAEVWHLDLIGRGRCRLVHGTLIFIIPLLLTLKALTA